MAITFAISFGRDSHGHVTRGHVCHIHYLMHGTSSHPAQHSTRLAPTYRDFRSPYTMIKTSEIQ